MIMKKIVYIIPGYTESYLKKSDYRKVAKIFEAHGIQPIHVEIDWEKDNPKKFSGYKEQFLKVYKKPKGVEVYVLGFSFGATIAFLTANKTKPKGLILCSLSPYFNEDVFSMNPKWTKWFKDTFKDSQYSFVKLVTKVKSPTFLVVGDKEPIACIRRAKDAKKKIPAAKLFIATGAKHKIGQKEYLVAIKKVVSKL